MGAVSKVVAVILRLGELACGVVLLGILGRFLNIITQANTYADSRIIYTVVVACMAISFSILLLPPFTYSFMAFPVDFILFTLCLVAFCLLETLTSTNTCNSVWYWSYWGFYWGGFWRNPFVVNGPGDIRWAGCSAWKTVLAFTFMSSMAFLCSAFLGAYVVMKYRVEKRHDTPSGSQLPTAYAQNGSQPTGHAQNGTQPMAYAQNGSQPTAQMGEASGEKGRGYT